MKCSTPHGRASSEHYSPAGALSDSKTGWESSLASASPGGPPDRHTGGHGGGVGAPSGAPAAALVSSSSILINEHKSSSSCQHRTYEQELKEGDRGGIRGLPRRLERYARAHQRAMEMGAFLADLSTWEDIDWQRRRLAHRARELNDCGSFLGFRHYLTVDQVRCFAGHFCQQDRLCPLCAIRRGVKLLRRYTERVLAVRAERPDLIPLHVVFTIKDGENLGERLAHLRACQGKLYGRRRRGNRTEADKALGVVSSVEITRGKNSGGWHVHTHAVWLCEQLPDVVKLRVEWKSITGDSHVLRIDPFHFWRHGHSATPENIAQDFVEVFKYALKFSELSIPDNWLAFEACSSKRLVQSYGSLYGVPEPTDLADSLLSDDLPYVDHFFRFSGGKYRQTA